MSTRKLLYLGMTAIAIAVLVVSPAGMSARQAASDIGAGPRYTFCSSASLAALRPPSVSA